MNSMRKWVWRARPSAWCRGSAHQWWPLSRVWFGWDPEGSGAGEQRKRLYRGEWGKGPPRGRAVTVLGRRGLAEPYFHFILYGGIHPRSLGTLREGALPGHSTRHPWGFLMPSTRSQVPTRAHKTCLTLACPRRCFPIIRDWTLG